MRRTQPLMDGELIASLTTRVSTTRPVVLFHSNLHLITVNSVALERAGIGRDKPQDFPGKQALLNQKQQGVRKRFATMIVDVDHLLADPIYDPGRCSIGFHPLHQYPVIGLYAVLAAWPKLRLVGIGLLIHMALDGVDCVWMRYEIG